MTTVKELALQAKAAMSDLAHAPVNVRNHALINIAEAFHTHTDAILSANQTDIDAARQSGYPEAFCERLTLTPARIAGMADGARQIAAMPDPIGSVEGGTRRPNGIIVTRQRVPLGLVGVIFESRPNVTADAACLCLKSGNACLLRGGKEAIRTNQKLVDIMRDAIVQAGLPANILCLIQDISRQSAHDLMQLNGILDVLIPRGGASLIRSVVENARVPVIETGVGICHVFVDENADIAMALAIVENAKCHRPSVCNAMETLLVARKIAPVFLPKLYTHIPQVSWRACPETLAMIGHQTNIQPASDEDYATEYNDLMMNVKIVGSLYEATAHIAQYGTRHSEAIITRDYFTARRFVDRVDAAAVYINASTRFTDGEVFGLGAEIGVSTQKLHARGPMGLDALTTIQYVVLGEGQIRQ